MFIDSVISLDDPAAREAAVAGEKAAALARLRQHGLPVPGGFVVPAAASTAAMAGVAAEIEAHLAALDGSVRELEQASRAVRTLVDGLTAPPALAEAVAAAHAEMGAGAVVAVRSSGTAEDLPGASFAGQYDSFLNVTSIDALLDRLVAVWGSLYSAHAVAYRQRAGLPLAGVQMAVLVQRQLDANAAGVLFTHDPMSGDSGRMVVNVALGLGEGVVAGEVPADTFALDAESLAIVDRTVVEKATMVAARADGGGIEQQAVPAARRREPALSDAQLTALGRLAQSVRELEDGDRDIEFAVVDGEVQLLQARPVTGVDDDLPGDLTDDQQGVEWGIAGSEDESWFSAISFSVPQPIARFEEDLRHVYSVNARTVFQETGVPMARAHRITVVHGFPYQNAPRIDSDELKTLIADRIRFRSEFEATGRSYYLDEIEPEVLEHLERLGPFRRPAGESLASRFAFLEQALASYGRVQGDLHWRQLQGRPQGEEEAWPRQFSDFTGLPEVDSGTLLQAVENKTTRMVRRLRGLARIVQSDTELAAAFAEREFERVSESPLRARPATRRFRARFAALLRDFGRRNGRSFGSGSSFMTPTWNLDPNVPLDLIASYATQDLDRLDRLEREARAERVAATSAARRLVDAESRADFDAAVAAARLSVVFMENHNTIMEQGVAGVMREAIWWMGHALARRGRMAEPDDAVHLSLDELRAIARGEDESDLLALVKERKAEFAQRSRLRPPGIIGKTPSAGGMPVFDQAPDGAGLEGSVLRGTAASRGTHTGRARVYPPGGERPDVEPGDILVARNAGQDWTPVLSLLGGIVLDEGAVFQHAALVAREYRIPAVIQTKEATTAIKDGEIITVDGSEGVVELGR